MINIRQNIKSLCKKRILIPGAFFLLTIFILLACPFINIFHPTKIESIFDVKKSDKYITANAKTLYYTGYNLIKTGNKTYGYYYCLKNDKTVFVIIPIGADAPKVLKNYQLKAKVSSPDRAYKKMLKNFSKDLNWNEKGIQSVTSEYVLSSASYHPIAYSIIFWCVLVILFSSIKNIIESVIWYFNPNIYPICSFLGKSMQQDIIEEAQYELDHTTYIRINDMYITENYFVNDGDSRICVIPLMDIVWCYRLSNISMRLLQKDSYSIKFTIRSGSDILINNKTSDEALELVNAIKATEYDIIIGHSDAKRRIVKKRIQNVPDRN